MAIEKISTWRCRCERCGHAWLTRTDKKPGMCPNCKRIKWNSKPTQLYEASYRFMDDEDVRTITFRAEHIADAHAVFESMRFPSDELIELRNLSNSEPPIKARELLAVEQPDVVRCARVRRHVYFEGYFDVVCGKRAKDEYGGRCGQCFNKPDPGLIYRGLHVGGWEELTPLGATEEAFLAAHRAKQRLAYEKYKRDHSQPVT